MSPTRRPASRRSTCPTWTGCSTPSTARSDGEPVTRVREFPLPDLGEGLTEGEILKWLVSEGDMITLNQPIVEVETAKAAVEIPAKWAGKVARIFHGEGETIEVGTPIIAIDTDPTAGDLPEPSAESLAAVEVAPAEGMVEPGLIGGPAPGGRTAVLVGYGPKAGAATRRPRIQTPAVVAVPAATSTPAPVRPAPAPAPSPVPAEPVRGGGETLAKPPVRKLARDLGVDLTALVGSGPSGSITRDDVMAAQNGTVSAPTAPSFGPDREQRVPVKGVRK